MCNDVEFKIRFTQPTFQRFYFTNEKLRIFDIIPAPIVRENEKRIRSIFSCRRLPTPPCLTHQPFITLRRP